MTGGHNGDQITIGLPEILVSKRNKFNCVFSNKYVLSILNLYCFNVHSNTDKLF